MKKWELARYIIDCKKSIDSIMYISENLKELSNLRLREIINEKLRIFYINIRIVYDKSMSKSQKKELKQDDQIYIATMYEADKNYAHKDNAYEFKEMSSYKKLIIMLQEQLLHCFNLCKERLPECLTFDYVPHDYNLYRFVNCITPDKEKDIRKKLHIKEEEESKENLGKELKIFNDTEDISLIDDKSDYAIYLEEGMTLLETLQNKQDFCIKANVLYDLNMWCTANLKLLLKMETYRKEIVKMLKI